VKELLHQAEVADRDKLPDGLDIPQEIARREARLAAITAAKAKIVARAAERDALRQAEYEEKVARREAHRAAVKKPRGQEPSPPTQGPQAKDQVNRTDAESRIMPRRGGFVQGYNAHRVRSKLM